MKNKILEDANLRRVLDEARLKLSVEQYEIYEELLIEKWNKGPSIDDFRMSSDFWLKGESFLSEEMAIIKPVLNNLMVEVLKSIKE